MHHAQDIKPIVDALHGAERPVLYVGGGCLDAAPELREFVARTGIPVAQTLMGLGAFPESDPLALQARALLHLLSGVSGMHARTCCACQGGLALMMQWHVRKRLFEAQKRAGGAACARKDAGHA
jgi:TPP-dependent trihydroxycyclohexane-1,2-dione (THcHDO) dehydratase